MTTPHFNCMKICEGMENSTCLQYHKSALRLLSVSSLYRYKSCNVSPMLNSMSSCMQVLSSFLASGGGVLDVFVILLIP